jgi:hypothetical protein
MRILVIDVGGTNVKVSLSGKKYPIRIPSGPHMTAARMAAEVKKAIEGWKYDAVSIGYPGPVVNDKPANEPKNLGAGWVRFDYGKAFGLPVRVVNDAAMQALGSYQGGRIAWPAPARSGRRTASPSRSSSPTRRMKQRHIGLSRAARPEAPGPQEMAEARREGRDILKHGLQDYAMLGGGNSKNLKHVPAGARLGSNECAIDGGIRLWKEPAHRDRHRQAHISAPPPPAGRAADAAIAEPDEERDRGGDRSLL